MAKAVKLSHSQRAPLGIACPRLQGVPYRDGFVHDVNLKVHLAPGVSLKSGLGVLDQKPGIVTSALARLSPEPRNTVVDIEPSVLSCINASPAAKAGAVLATEFRNY